MATWTGNAKFEGERPRRLLNAVAKRGQAVGKCPQLGNLLRARVRSVLTASLLWALISCLLAGSASAAGPIEEGSLTSGIAVSGELLKTDQEGIAYTFMAVAGQHVTVTVTNPHVEGELEIRVKDASGGEDAGASTFTTSATNVNFTPTTAEAGLTTVVIASSRPSIYSPYSSGTFTLTYAKDVTGELTAGTPTEGTIDHLGQDADYTFTAVAGQHVTLAVSGPHVEGELEMKVKDASGAEDAGAVTITTSPTNINFTPTTAEAGPTTVVIAASRPSIYSPYSTGSFTLTYAKDVTGQLVAGTSTQGAIDYLGQNADYTFTAVAGQPATLAITNPDVEGALEMKVEDSSGAEDTGAVTFTTTPAEIKFTPTAADAGPTTVVITSSRPSIYSPYSTGSFTLTYDATMISTHAVTPVRRTAAETEAALAIAFGLPSAKACYSRRAFAIHIRQPRGYPRIVSAEVFLGKRRERKLSKRGLSDYVVLRGLPKGTFTIRVVARTANGEILIGARTYHTCRPKR